MQHQTEMKMRQATGNYLVSEKQFSGWHFIQFRGGNLNTRSFGGHNVPILIAHLNVRDSPVEGTLRLLRRVSTTLQSNADWVEGTEVTAQIGDPPDVGMYTWKNRIQGTSSSNSTPWAGGVGAGVPGVDYYENVLAEFSYDETTTGFAELELDPDFVNGLVNSWTCGPNAGLFLRVEETEQDNEIRFYSRDAADIEDRPQLIIDYEPISIGDVNRDGAINLLDVAPFVQALTDGVYLPNADINEDCVLDLLDVAPFVDLLSN